MTAVEEQLERAGMRRTGRVRLADQVHAAVIFGGRQHDLTLPATIPVAVVVESVLSVLLDDSALREPGDDEMVTAGSVTLTRINGAPLVRSETLAAQNVRDGEVLILQISDAQVTLTTVTENASSAIAQILATTRTEVTEAVAVRFAAIAAGAAALLATVMALAAWRIELGAGKYWHIWPSAATAGLAVVLVVVGSLVRRGELVVANTMWLSALVAAPAAAVMATPGKPGVWHAVFGLVVAIATSATLWRLTPVPRGLMAWVLITGLGFLAVSLIHAAGVSMTYLWVAVGAVALLVLKTSPGLAARMAGVAMPPFPTITGKLVFQDADTMAAEALVAAEHNGTPAMADLIRTANRANTYLTSVVAATAPFFVLGAWGAPTMPGHGRWWLSTAYVLILAAVLVLGGRGFAHRVQAIIVVATALVMTTVMIIKYALWFHSSLGFLAAGTVILGLGVAGLVLTAVVPSKVFSPVFRKLIEWLEYALIVLVPPMAFWLLNLYYLARHR